MVDGNLPLKSGPTKAPVGPAGVKVTALRCAVSMVTVSAARAGTLPPVMVNAPPAGKSRIFGRTAGLSKPEPASVMSPVKAAGYQAGVVVAGLFQWKVPVTPLAAPGAVRTI